MALSVGEHLVAEARRNTSGLAVLIVERLDLGLLNESLGNDAGDELIRHTSRNVLAAAEPNFVARLGANEYVILAPSAYNVRTGNDTDQMALLATKLQAAIDQAVVVRGVEISGTSACGIALFPEDGQSFDALLRAANRACKESHVSGGSTYHFYNEAMELRNATHVRLMADLRVAIKENSKGFWLAYQPKVDLTTGRIIGMEALLRWDHERFGRVPPETFISIAEVSGNIVELGAWVLHKACRDAVGWQGGPLHDVSVAVNVSVMQFMRGDIASTIEDVLRTSGLKPQRLVLEVTESLFVSDAESLRLTIQRLRALGVRFAIDDFGTGYSNLGYLQRFQVDTLKIDRSFVLDLETNDKNLALVRAIVGMANALDMHVVAEGIESQAAAAKLLEVGCHAGQGYLWSEPVSAEVIATRWRSAEASDRQPPAGNG